MKLVSKTLAGRILAFLLCLAATARAQLVPDGGSVLINNFTTNLSTSLTIGTNGPNTGLTIVNQGKVFSTGGTIGLNVLSANNAVAISDPGSQWGYGSSLTIGGSGPRNQFTILSGGVAFGDGGSIGSAGGSHSNVVLLLNPSSLWQVANIIRVGVGGESNLLTIGAGARVTDRIGYVGAGLGASHNVAHLTDPGSAWNHRELMVVGLFGRSNQLHIANSASVTSSNSVIGAERDASGNFAQVSVGAIWTTGDRLTVGSNSFYNQLVVTNGGRVSNADLVVGYTPSGGTNRVVVTGQNSILTNSGRLWLGYFSSSNTLTISNGGWVAAGEAFIGGHADAIARTLSSANQVLVQDIGSRFILNVLRVGNEGTNNRLIIQKGGLVTAGALVTVGGTASANHNTVLVTDPASSLSSDRLLYMGSDGANNRLIITNGGRVTNATFAYIGLFNSATNNTVLISDPGSLWSTGEDPSTLGWLYVGDQGPRNSLTVSNRGTLSSDDTWIGNESAGNTMLVTGPGSLWTNSGFVTVGSVGARNQLTISNGARFVSSGGIIGQASGGRSNSVVLTGAGSVWTNSGELTVGFSGSQAQMTIANGAQLFTDRATMGLIGSNNSVFITGPGSLWVNNSTLDLGGSGSLNELSISNQAILRIGSSLTIGVDASSVDNSLGVHTGASVWVTNAARNGLLDVRRGRLTSGSQVQIITDKLLLTNGAASRFQFTGGMLQTAGTVVSNGSALVVGDGADTPVFVLNGGTHVFANGLTISSNATLRGCGTIHGPVINRGTIIADCPGETLSFSGAFTNLGTIYSTNGGRLQFSAPLFAITRITKTATTANVTFTTIKALRFTLEYKDNLTNPNWTSILPPLTGDGTPLTRPDFNATAPTRFYRLRAE